MTEQEERENFRRQQALSQIRRIRSSPDYVPEFPPSSLIDDSPEGCVNAARDLGFFKDRK